MQSDFEQKLGELIRLDAAIPWAGLSILRLRTVGTTLIAMLVGSAAAWRIEVVISRPAWRPTEEYSLEKVALSIVAAAASVVLIRSIAFFAYLRGVSARAYRTHRDNADLIREISDGEGDASQES
jgi:hypothetical protein